MSLTLTKKLVLGAAVGAVAMGSALAPAMAKGPHHHHHHFRWVAPLAVASTTYSCDYYYWKWQKTGANYWRYQYFACIR